MPNSIALFKKYIDKLDTVYKLSSLTSKLDMSGGLVRAGANTNEISIPKMQLNGLGDYSRNDGYANGNVTIDYETVTFNYDRGRRMGVDFLDNEETAGVAFGQLASEFIRTKVVPEMDAFRFASYAGKDGISLAAPATFRRGADVIAALVEAQTTMDENEVPAEDRHLFITPTLYNMATSQDLIAYTGVLDQFASITKVPQSRFYTAITLLSGAAGDEFAGGFKKADGASDINFMILHKPALLQYSKHIVNKIISPQANQTSDQYLFFYRAYGLADALENKLDGIYLHAKEASVSTYYTVTFNSDGGSAVDPQRVLSGETATEPSPAPTKDGFNFTAWILGGQVFDFSTPITEDITLTATWTEI